MDIRIKHVNLNLVSLNQLYKFLRNKEFKINYNNSAWSDDLD